MALVQDENVSTRALKKQNISPFFLSHHRKETPNTNLETKALSQTLTTSQLNKKSENRNKQAIDTDAGVSVMQRLLDVPP